MGSRTFAIMVVFGGMLVLGNLPGTAAQCGGDFPELSQVCQESLQDNGPPPTPECCFQIGRIDMACAQQYVDDRPGIEERSGISLARAAAVASDCAYSPYPAPPPEVDELIPDVDASPPEELDVPPMEELDVPPPEVDAPPLDEVDLEEVDVPPPEVNPEEVDVPLPEIDPEVDSEEIDAPPPEVDPEEVDVPPPEVDPSEEVEEAEVEN